MDRGREYDRRDYDGASAPDQTRRRERSRKWDDMGAAPAPLPPGAAPPLPPLQAGGYPGGQLGALPVGMFGAQYGVQYGENNLAQQHYGSAMQAQMTMQGARGDKKQREVYVGNLLQNQVTAQMIQDFFSKIFAAIPSFDSSQGPAINNVQLSGAGKFAFVEMRDETLAATMMLLDKLELCGRLLNVGRPTGFVQTGFPPKPLDTSMLRLPGLGGAQPMGMVAQQAPGYAPMPLSANPLLAMMTGLPTMPSMGGALGAPTAPDNKKQRELYVGNLAVGLVSAPMLKDLFQLPLQSMPGFDLSKGAAVVNVDMSAEGKFAFVELRDEVLAHTAVALLQDMELCGRKLHVGRPRGYVDPAGGTGLGGAAPLNPAFNPLLAGSGFPGYPPMAGLPRAPAMPGAPGLAFDPMATGTPFLLLENLVGDPGPLRDNTEYNEIIGDIHSECSKSGGVLEVRVPRPGRPGAEPYLGRAYVRFIDIGAARAAMAALNGRQFDGNVVRATFVTALVFNAVPAN
ncbi:hypothetical protein T492DRAFT_610206 [Pavlovales sp. CCMP2436]|nr:hypothetical protein T492DRAFT_610206 [Pavlovales sp. CCMP2436]